MVRCAAVRILLDYRPALRQRTGVGEYVHELARALAAGAQRERPADRLALLTTSWKDRLSPAAAEELAGVALIDRRVPVRPLTWSWNRLGWPPVEWLAGEHDVVHAQSPLLIPSRSAAQVVTIHDLDFLDRPDRAEAEMRRDYPDLVRDHAHRADHIVVSSRYAAGEVVRRLGVPASRVTVCSPGVPGWAPQIAAARAAPAEGPILFLGTLSARKNVAGLLDAYALLRGRRSDAPPLVLAGHITDAAKPLVERSRQPALEGSVRWPGYVPDDARPEMFRQARMLVLPSFEEGFGLPVLEAMACGVPVVISNRGSLPEVAGAAAVAVPPDDIEGLSTQMERLLDPDVAREAATRGLEQASRFTWEQTAQSALAAYRAALAHRSSRGR